MRTAACVSFLLSQGASPSHTDSDGLTATAHALAFDHVNVLSVLPVRSLDIDNLNPATSGERERSDRNVRSALHIVCQWGSIKCLNYLIQINSIKRMDDDNADDNVDKSNNDNSTNNGNDNRNNEILRTNEIEKADKLNSSQSSNPNLDSISNCNSKFNLNSNLNSDFDLNIAMTDGTTPLHLSARYGHLNCIKLLISYGVDFAVLDCNGNSPLMLSKLWCRKDCEKYLTEISKDE